MRPTVRLYVAGFAVIFFLLVMAITPERTESKSSRPDKDSKTQKGKTKGTTSKTPARERSGANQAGTPNSTYIVDGDDDEEQRNDPDLPAKKLGRDKISKAEYMRLRDEHIGKLRGMGTQQCSETTAYSAKHARDE